MPDDIEQAEGFVASFVGGLTNFLGRNSGSIHRETSNAVVEQTETDSPLNVLNQEALKNAPETWSISPKLKKTVITELAQKKPQTRSSARATIGQSSKLNGQIRSVSIEKAKGEAISS